MRTIETTATVRPDGTLVVPVPPVVNPGEYRVVVVLEEQTATFDPVQKRALPFQDLSPWPEGLSQNWEG